ncbi:hypothetical protein GQ53DRAFT_285999 [Thozetella sp. PMI_491]|nr:hypothetical protein GQ53DRAFT_285999 [Thozetella sp. PMI_491]
MDTGWPSSRIGVQQSASQIPRRPYIQGQRQSSNGPRGQGPTSHEGEIIQIPHPARPSAALTYATAYSKAPSYGQFNFEDDENIPPTSPEASEVSRPKVPKSRTFNVLANITQSLSRTSLSSYHLLELEVHR